MHYIARSPVKRLVQSARFIFNIRAYLELARDIRISGLEEITARYPEYRFKYLGNYLTPGFSVSQRAAALGYTYRFLTSQTILPFRSIAAGGQAEIWSCAMEGEKFDVILAPVGEAFLEGDMALVFRRNGNPLYRLSFSFLPGRFAGILDRTILFIGGSQGYRGTAEDSRIAAKRLGEICPATLLLIHLRAIAKLLGLNSVAAIAVSEHSCQTITSGTVHPVSAYDDFWESNGAIRCGRFFRMPAELSFRPSTAASSSHRARARRKQERKSRLYAEILAGFGMESGTEVSGWLDSSVRPQIASHEPVLLGW
jgi:uncharacterized protein VirK/YbjX